MTIKTENEVRKYKKYIEGIVESLNKRYLTDENYNTIDTIRTLEDEIEVLKCVLNEECDPISGKF